MNRRAFVISWGLWLRWRARGGIWASPDRRRMRLIDRPQLWRLWAHIRAEFEEEE